MPLAHQIRFLWRSRANPHVQTRVSVLREFIADSAKLPSEIAMSNSFSTFQQKLIDIAQLKSAFAVLNWDKDVFMPPKGSAPRAAMLGYLAGELHDKILSQEFRTLLREA